jgi:hypothetical protein
MQTLLPAVPQPGGADRIDQRHADAAAPGVPGHGRREDPDGRPARRAGHRDEAEGDVRLDELGINA